MTATVCTFIDITDTLLSANNIVYSQYALYRVRDDPMTFSQVCGKSDLDPGVYTRFVSPHTGGFGHR